MKKRILTRRNKRVGILGITLFVVLVCLYAMSFDPFSAGAENSETNEATQNQIIVTNEASSDLDDLDIVDDDLSATEDDSLNLDGDLPETKAEAEENQKSDTQQDPEQSSKNDPHGLSSTAGDSSEQIDLGSIVINPGFSVDSTTRAPRAYGEGTVTIDGVVFACLPNGEATLGYAKNYSGVYTVPKSIVGIGGETYTVTSIGSYSSNDGRTIGAFQNNQALAGLKFEEGSQLRSIAEYAFASCYGLQGAIDLPSTVVDIGSFAFDFGSFGKISRMSHPHVVTIDEELPKLNDGSQIERPAEMNDYESVVEGYKDNTTLYKGARWTDANLSEAELRLDFGKRPNESGKVDFVFVIDMSPSMLEGGSYTTDGKSHKYPRNLLTNDIVSGISKVLLDSGQEGYDNRVAMTAFATNTLWTSDFTKDSHEIEQTLFNNPLINDELTNYSSGLASARNLIRNRSDKSRVPVVVFLSDGAPKGNTSTTDIWGAYEASQLRSMGVKVYPIAIYSQSFAALENISYSGSTAYSALDSEAFKTILSAVVEEILQEPTPLVVTLTDVLGDEFDFRTGTSSDVSVSAGGGSVTLSGSNLVWKLDGCAPDKLHTAIVKIKLKNDEVLRASGELPTNSALSLSDNSLNLTEQPVLVRYLVSHEFVNRAGPDQQLPTEVTQLLPPPRGGYRDKAEVTPSDPSSIQVHDAEGNIWDFLGWDKKTDKIDAANVVFIGKWRLSTLNLLFAKINENHEAISGASFAMYFWEGNSAPTGDDEYVNKNTIAPGKWRIYGNVIESAKDPKTLKFTQPGYYQMLETAVPSGYYRPETQWRFDVNDEYLLNDIKTISIDKNSFAEEDIVKEKKGDDEVWYLVNHRQADFLFYKVSGPLFEADGGEPYALPGAEFELYYWTGASAPGKDELVNPSSLSGGNWLKVSEATSSNTGEVHFVIHSESDWIYQLVETSAAPNHSLPTGQWRISFDANGAMDNTAIMAIPGANGMQPPALSQSAKGHFAGKLTLVNVPIYEFPQAGGIGRNPYLIAGILFVSAGFIVGRKALKYTKHGFQSDRK